MFEPFGIRKKVREAVLPKIDLLPGEAVIDQTLATYYGPKSLSEVDVARVGSLFLTNQRVVFSGGLAAGHGAKKEIGIPLAAITNTGVEIPARMLAGQRGQTLCLVVYWNDLEGQHDLIFLTQKTRMDPVGNASEWKTKIDNMINAIRQPIQQPYVYQCPNCGGALTGGKFCPHCGSKVE